MIKNILIGTVLVLVIVASAGATEVRVDPASQTVTAGDAFYMNITVEDVVNIKGNAAGLNFDPGVMQVTGITEGNFLKTGGSTIGVGNWDNIAGTAAFGYSLGTGTWTAVSGSGTFATIEFDIYPDAPAGVYDLSLTNVEIRDTNNELIQADISNDSVTVLSPPTTATATPTATRTSTSDVSEKGVVVFGGTEEGVADTHVTDVIDSTPATTTPTTATTPDTTTNVSANATTDTPAPTPASTPSSVPGLSGTDMIAAGGILTILFAIRKRKWK